MVLYINDEHCTSLAQLKCYFHENPTLGSEIYAELLDYGRYGDIAQWLREVVNEAELSSKVASISTDLTDSAFYAQLKAVITGDASCSIPIKPSFEECFSFEDLKCDVNGAEARVRVSLKVLMCVNEEYELRISCNWGMRTIMVNPYNHQEGKLASFDFIFHKRPGKDIGEITVEADDIVISQDTKKKFSQSLENDDAILVGDVKFKMIHVEGGTFTMGATPEQAREGLGIVAVPAHEVALSSYSIGETLVTQALWQTVMVNNPSFFKGVMNPVENVSWNDCMKFIQKLNQLTGRQFRLPTEAEWEYAARGGAKSKGFDYFGSDNPDEVAWYLINSNNTTHPVKTKKPNELGIYDMSGNVWEWCQDWDGHYKSGSQTNPTGPAYGTGRIIRGGCWDCYFDISCRSRGWFKPISKSNYLGIRLVLSE